MYVYKKKHTHIIYVLNILIFDKITHVYGYFKNKNTNTNIFCKIFYTILVVREYNNNNIVE